MFCASCGSALSPSALFCSTCGLPATRQRTAVAASAPVRAATHPAPAPAPHAPPIPRQELTAALHARQELGERLEDEVVDTFLSRVERAIDARVDARLQGQLPAVRRRGGNTDVGGVWLALGSLGMGIPITAIAGSMAHLPGIIAVWAGIAIVNIAYNQRQKD